MAVFGRNKPPSRFNNTATTLKSHIVDGTIIQGRLLPNIEPYCRASFLIQITLPREYPMEDRDIFILDPIYHPNINDCGKGKGSRGWGFVFGQQFDPTTALTVYVEAIIHVVNNITDSSYNDIYNCAECIKEYRDNRQRFFEKALGFTLSYGRPRY
jgi:ubiquitin-protein ligase